MWTFSVSVLAKDSGEAVQHMQDNYPHANRIEHACDFPDGYGYRLEYVEGDYSDSDLTLAEQFLELQ